MAFGFVVESADQPGNIGWRRTPYLLLASRRRRVLQVTSQATYNHDQVVSMYASNALRLFDPSMVRNEMVTSIRKRGPNEAIGYAFSSYASVLAPIAEEVAHLSVEYLRSGTPEQVSAAVHLLCVLREKPYGLRTATLNKVNNYLGASLDRIVEQKNEAAALWLAQFLSRSKSPSSGYSLWGLVDAHLATEESLICITWLRNPSDLPKLVAIVETNDPSDPYGYQHEAVVGNLFTGYGDIVRPYLREILDKSKQVWVRVSAAKELALMNDSAGNQFFISTLQQHPFYHDEMLRWLRDTFPSIHDVDETKVLTFLEDRGRDN